MVGDTQLGQRDFGVVAGAAHAARYPPAAPGIRVAAVAVFGTIGGLALGLLLARAVMSSLAGEFTSTAFTIPALPLAVTLALGALAGALAAMHPAHRAARMDVLSAIVTE